MNILMGIGNPLCGDDGIGPYIARTFQKEGWLVLNCGTAPENFTSILRREKPELVILVDAASLGLPAGEFRSIPPDKIMDVSIGTHGPSLTAFLHFVSSFIPRILFIGIQPEHICETETITISVVNGAHKLMKILKKERFREIQPFNDG
jgi:hydrogenase 3 maturation protease